ncbi:ROK family transcriptional regulator, partial [Enterococcus sp. RIT-PI-f]|uniref:ROK family transcriptional regulator n=1 Tax=Enterococcus sp. RIT-PI-f TaxID=1690244 RepID=UPI00356626F1
MITKKQLELCSDILNVIYSEGPISRVDISKKTGITPATVSFLTGMLIEKNFLYELGESYDNKIKAGRRKILLDISKQRIFFIGAEISETFYSFVLTDNTGEIISHKVYTIDESKKLNSSKNFIDNLLSFYEQSVKPVSAIGIALPGHYNNSNLILTNNSKWETFELQKIVDAVEKPVFFENNVHCMALAEHFFYNKNDEDFIFFHISKGIYCSYFYKGDIFSKDNFLIGELGHTVVNMDGPMCECGKKGCLQTYTSENWLLKYSKSIYNSASSTLLHQLVSNENDISLKTITDAYNLGDPAILKLIDRAVRYISLTLNNLNMIFDYSKLFIHGKIFENDGISNS